MGQGLIARIGADDREFSEVLERSGRKWKVFGREVNQGANELGRVFGGTAAGLGKLGQGFQLAGTAAGVFAGADGLLGIAGSLATGGLVMGGMAALSFAMRAFEKDAEEAKNAAEQFNKEIGRLPQNQRGLSVLESNINTLKNALARLHEEQEKQATPAASAVGAAGLGTEIARQGGIVNYVKGIFGGSEIDRTIQQLTKELDASSTAADDLGNALRTPEAKAAALAEATRKAAQEMERLKRAAQSINLRGELEAWRLTQPNYIGGSVTGGVAYQSMFAGMKLDALSQAQPHGNLMNPLSAKDLNPELFGAVREFVEGQKDETNALISGFDELPNALAGVLAPLLASVFGNNRGAQIGGTLGGAFGTGVGGFWGKSVATSIGGALGAGVGSFVPVIGTLVGGLLGGAIGGLFGGHKRSVDANTAALQELNQTLKLTNVPEGYKVGRAAFRAQDAVSIIMDGREVARAVVSTLRRESQAQFGTSTRWAEVAI